IGGNLVSARPAADFPPSLLAYDARVVLKSRKGERQIPLDEFFKGPGETMAESGEILTRVVLPKSPEGAGSAYIKLGLRKALEISLVNVAAYLALDEGGAVREARIALGSVAPTPVRAPSGEQVLVGEKPSDALFAEAGKRAVADTSPIDDFRASAAYKRDMVKVLTRRALSQALESIRAK
ncbi:MAG: xanthine dehydrogenase family protein subunit M, partial [Deltaproteobacteria bacterium]